MYISVAVRDIESKFELPGGRYEVKLCMGDGKHIVNIMISPSE